MGEVFFIKNQIQEVRHLTDKIYKFCKARITSADIINDIILSLEEAIVNIISYGYKDSKKDSTIRIDLNIDDNLVRIKIVDDGLPFNPLEDTPMPDLDSPLKDRPVGGLGVFLVKTLMDHLDYKREKNTNILILEKRLS